MVFGAEQQILQAILLCLLNEEEEGELDLATVEEGSDVGGASMNSEQHVGLDNNVRVTLRSALRNAAMPASPAATLRGLRRQGPLAGLSQAGYHSLMGGTLYEYHDAAEASFSASMQLPRERAPAGSDLAETFQMLETAIVGLNTDAASPSGLFPSWPPLAEEMEDPMWANGNEEDRQPTHHLAGITAGSSGFWRSGRSEQPLDFWRNDPMNASAGSDSFFSATGDSALGNGMALGGDGQATYDMHALLRRMVSNGEITTSLAAEAERMMQLGSAASGQSLTEEEIEALPKVRFDDAEHQTCAICLDAYQHGELLTALSCNHFFHVACLARWFHRSTQCPLCRSSQRDG